MITLRGGYRKWFLMGMSCLTVLAAYSSQATADRYESPSFTIDASVGNSFGGQSDSANYSLVSSGGEAVIGNGASGSYKLGQGYVAQLEQSLQLTVQPHGLAAYYPFETADGTRVYDNSANSIDANRPAAVTKAAGKLQQALVFDGTAAISLNNPSQLQITGDQTISMWVKPSDTTTQQSLYSKAYGGEGSIVQEVGGNMNYSYGTAGGNTTPYENIMTVGTAPAGSWTHVVIVRDLTNGKLIWYMNGMKDTEATASYAAATASSLNAYIGQGHVNNYKGSIDELKIFSRALTAEEIKADYNAAQAGYQSSASLRTITPGISQSNFVEAVVQTDGPSYGVAINQNQDLTGAGGSIAAISSGTIASPVAWNEGTTKGFGFTLTDALSRPAKWGTGPSFAYAAVPGTTTTFYTRTGYSGGTKDVMKIQYRIDTPGNQTVGTYSNTVSYGATIIP